MIVSSRKHLHRLLVSLIVIISAIDVKYIADVNYLYLWLRARASIAIARISYSNSVRHGPVPMQDQVR